MEKRKITFLSCLILLLLGVLVYPHIFAHSKKEVYSAATNSSSITPPITKHILPTKVQNNTQIKQISHKKILNSPTPTTVRVANSESNTTNNSPATNTQSYVAPTHPTSVSVSPSVISPITPTVTIPVGQLSSPTPSIDQITPTPIESELTPRQEMVIITPCNLALVVECKPTPQPPTPNSGNVVTVISSN